MMPHNEDPLERAERLARELMDVQDDDEATSPEIHVTVNVPRESRPDSDPPTKEAKRELHAGLKVLGVALGIGAVTGAITLLQQCH
jgi:hypothetical protein